MTRAEFVLSASQRILSEIAVQRLTSHMTRRDLAEESVELAEMLYGVLSTRGYFHLAPAPVSLPPDEAQSLKVV